MYSYIMITTLCNDFQISIYLQNQSIQKITPLPFHWKSSPSFFTSKCSKTRCFLGLLWGMNKQYIHYGDIKLYDWLHLFTYLNSVKKMYPKTLQSIRHINMRHLSVRRVVFNATNSKAIMNLSYRHSFLIRLTNNA